MKIALVRLIAGSALVLAAAGMVHGTRASIAQGLYYHTRFGLFGEDLEQVLARAGTPRGHPEDLHVVTDAAERVSARCRRAQRLYPFNYRFCALASTCLYQAAAAGPASEQGKRFIRESAKWCGRGLALNVFSRDLRLRKAWLLWAAGKKVQAARAWQEYVDWDFWRGSNHRRLVDLYVKSGNGKKAIEAREWWMLLRHAE